MNDQFLYQLRTDPPPHFAEQLKQRLDRGPKRTTRALGFGLALLLFGSAFAMVSPTVRLSVAGVIEWIRGVPASTLEAPDKVNRGLARAFGDRKIEASEPTSPDREIAGASENAAREGARTLLEQMQTLRRGIAQLRSTADSGIDAAVADTERPDAAVGGSSDGPQQSSFIVTGPLLAEEGMPSYVFDSRRAYFRVMQLTTDSLVSMLKRRTPLDIQVAQTSGRRLEMLASMMPEMFAKDERTVLFPVPTRSQPRIWEQPDEFGREIDAFTAATRALSTSIGSHDLKRIQLQFVNVDRACTSCHVKFRKGANENVGVIDP
jgi:cytochrome c556